MKKVVLALAAGLALVSTVPAGAHPTGPKCKPVARSYRVSGKYVSSDLTKTNGKWSGTTLTITVTGANHAAKNAPSPFTVTKGSPATFDITGAHVSVASSAKTTSAGMPVAGDHVTVKGSLSELPGKCTSPTFTATLKVKGVAITPPNHKK